MINVECKEVKARAPRAAPVAATGRSEELVLGIEKTRSPAQLPLDVTVRSDTTLSLIGAMRRCLSESESPKAAVRLLEAKDGRGARSENSPD